ncbi:rhomboid family intramembrane serine protease [Halalkalibacter alkalisediminis]|uniref:Rhomboid family intramembrane serine protease n=1 Tax=Halalkalibacter alkalisediminis TaxID=935616 RepID=A0ABV6NBG5_9BACI|nr:rhomboid family intramembrane serine protease [Halalkalibacter alkalisediminis]
MEWLHQDYFFWKYIHHCVFQKGYRVHELNHKEAWLEDEDVKPRRFIRVVRIDIDFSSWLRRDVGESVNKFDQVRKQLRLGRLIGENVYISVYPPVDQWEEINKPFYESRKKRTTVYSSIIDRIKSNQLEISPAPSTHTIEELEFMIFALKQEIQQAIKQRESREKSLFFYGNPIATYLLLLSVAFMFYVLEQNGRSTSVLTLIKYGAKYNPLILDGEWWRLFTAMFLHIGFLHLFMNSLALFYLGGAVERMFGTSRFLLIYFIAGLSGSVASFAFNEQVAAGASGAIFGCFGALLYFGTIHKKLFFRTMGKNVLVVLVINLIFGFAFPMVDNGAHIGGLIGGFLASFIVQLPKTRFSVRQITFLFITVCYVMGLYWFGEINEKKVSSPLLELQIGQEYLQEEEIEKAYPFLQRAVDEGADIPEATFLLAYAEAKFENYEEAKTLLLKTVAKRPDFHEAHYNLSLIYVELDQLEEARASIQRAVQIHPEQAYLDLQERLQ